MIRWNGFGRRHSRLTGEEMVCKREIIFKQHAIGILLVFGHWGYSRSVFGEFDTYFSICGRL